MLKIKEISIVIPILNEEESILPLYKKIKSELTNLEKEIIFINDGSSDNSYKLISEIINQDPDVKMIHFEKNYGKAVALS